MGGSESVHDTYIGYRDGLIYKEIYYDGGGNDKYYLIATETSNLNLTDELVREIKEKKSLEINYCIANIPLNGINECAGLFGANKYIEKLDVFRIVPGDTKCLTLSFRPGIYIRPEHSPKLDLMELNYVEGRLCKIVYQDYNYNDTDLYRCCFLNDLNYKCNENLINDYKTNHCDVTMMENCKKFKSDRLCMRWLEQTYERLTNEALELYSQLCSENFDDEICDYFCKIARDNNDYRSEYCDRALKNWCKKNNSEKCFCLNTPSILIPELETYLGPKECWLSNCSSEANNKWLTTEQLKTRANCQLTNCSINIQNLTLNDEAKAKMINDCVSGLKVNSSDYYELSNKNINLQMKKTPGVFFNPELLLLSLSVLLISLSK